MIAPCSAPSMPVRFLAVSPDSATDLYELPMASAQAVAEMLRAAGMRGVLVSGGAAQHTPQGAATAEAA